VRAGLDRPTGQIQKMIAVPGEQLKSMFLSSFEKATAMKTHRIIILLFFLLIYPGSGFAIVYVNRQWDDWRKQWRTFGLTIEGETVTWNRDYQNAYGEAHDLPPGPPFIIESGILVTNVYDAEWNVLRYGSLTINTEGAGQDAFHLEFTLPPPNIARIIETEGHLSVIGAPSDRITITGDVDIIGRRKGVHQDHNVTFKYCDFSGVVYAHYRHSSLTFQSGNVVFDNCTFRSFPSELTSVVYYFDDYAAVPGNPNRYDFVMTNCTFENNPSGDCSYFGCVKLDALRSVVIRNCTFENNEARASGCVHLKRVDSVVLEDNRFNNNTVPSADYGVINISASGLTSIRGHSGQNNPRNVILVRGFVEDDAFIESSESLPLLVSCIDIEEGGTLRVGRGSVLKFYSAPLVDSYIATEGSLVADGTVFTSWEDDSHGGDTDLKAQPENVGLWGGPSGGILVKPSGSVTLSGCILQYAGRGMAGCGIYAENDLSISDSLFQKNKGFALKVSAEGGEDISITNSTFRQTDGTGIQLNHQTGSGVHFLMADSAVVQNDGVGVDLDLNPFEAGEVDIAISRSQICSNTGDGINLSYPDNLKSFQLVNCFLCANGRQGFIAFGDGQETAPIRIDSCLIAGNGFAPGYSPAGADFRTGTLEFINNTVAHNSTIGTLLRDLWDLTQSSVVNNIFYSNGNYGLAEENYSTDPYLAYNVFWGNHGSSELYFVTDSGTLRTVEEVQALGGDYASNMQLDPGFRPELTGTVTEIQYDEEKDESILTGDNADFRDRFLRRMIINPNTNQDVWFYITGNSTHAITMLGDIRDVASIGDTYRIFDFHLSRTSDVIDAGKNECAKRS